MGKKKKQQMLGTTMLPLPHRPMVFLTRPDAKHNAD